VRYFLLPHPPAVPSRLVLPLENLAPMALYEGPPPPPRASVVSKAAFDPNLNEQIDLLFAPEFDPDAFVVLEGPAPAPAGAAGPPGDAAAVITRDEPTEVIVRATVPQEGGYVLLRDSYDPYWRAEGDGQAAALLRAD